MRGEVLTRGDAQGCGCLRIVSHRKHGRSKTKEADAYSAAKQRCTNPKDPGFKNYGGRGILMAEKWLNDPAQFLKDMGVCPVGHSLDRIDNKTYNLLTEELKRHGVI